MSATPEQKDQIRELFRKHVPQVADGVVEIVSVAREVGHKCYVAVRSHDVIVDPVGSCTGPRGVRLKAIHADLNGERGAVSDVSGRNLHVVVVVGKDESVTPIEYFTVVRWENSSERFIANALRHLDASDVELNPFTHEAVASVNRETTDKRFDQSWTTREELELRLISELTGWKVSLRSGPG
jgi:N utilization substance protein A